jgi:hypothetical protein
MLASMPLPVADQRYLQAVTGRAPDAAGDDAFTGPLRVVAALAEARFPRAWPSRIWGDASVETELALGDVLDAVPWRHAWLRRDLRGPVRALHVDVAPVPLSDVLPGLTRLLEALGWPADRLAPLTPVAPDGVVTGLVVGTGRTRSRHLALEHAPRRGESP